VKRREGGHLSSEGVYLFSCMLHLPSELYIYIWSKNFSHSVNEKSEAKMAAIDIQ
jgi:hypothetical protein